MTEADISFLEEFLHNAQASHKVKLLWEVSDTNLGIIKKQVVDNTPNNIHFARIRVVHDLNYLHDIPPHIGRPLINGIVR